MKLRHNPNGQNKCGVNPLPNIPHTPSAPRRQPPWGLRINEEDTSYLGLPLDRPLRSFLFYWNSSLFIWYGSRLQGAKSLRNLLKVQYLVHLALILTHFSPDDN